MTEPTDVELWQLHMQQPGNAKTQSTSPAQSWQSGGQPAQAAEPVARLVIGKTKGGVSLTHMVVPAAFQLQEGMYALYTGPQPVAREPLPKFLALKFHARRDKKATVTLLFPGHEAADAWVRGIKGGQHGTE